MAACYRLGTAWATGNSGAERNPTAAQSLLRHCCEAGESSCCVSLGELQWRNWPNELFANACWFFHRDTYSVFRAACFDQQNPLACERAAAFAQAHPCVGEHEQSAPLMKQALDMSVRACDEGDHHACWNLGSWMSPTAARHRPDADKSTALRYLSRAYSGFLSQCEAGDLRSCLWAGHVAVEAELVSSSVSPNPAAATSSAAASSAPASAAAFPATPTAPSAPSEWWSSLALDAYRRCIDKKVPLSVTDFPAAGLQGDERSQRSACLGALADLYEHGTSTYTASLPLAQLHREKQCVGNEYDCLDLAYFFRRHPERLPASMSLAAIASRACSAGNHRACADAAQFKMDARARPTSLLSRL